MIAPNLYDSLDRYEEMLEIVEKSIKKVGKKVHRCEVMLHNEPLNEAHEQAIWQEKFDKLVKSTPVLRFPSIKEIRMHRKKKQEALKKNTKYGTFSISSNFI